MSPQRFSASAVLCGTLVINGWVAVGLADFSWSSVSWRAAVDIARASALGNASADNISVPNTGIGAALPEPREMAPTPTPPVVSALTSAPDPVPDDVGALAPPAIAGRGSIGATAPDPREMRPPATPSVAVAPASTPDPVQDDAEASAPSVDAAGIRSIGAAERDPGETTTTPSAPPVAIALASTPASVQDDVEASAPSVDAARKRDIGAAEPDPREAPPPAAPPVAIALASTPDPVENDTEAPAPFVDAARKRGIGAAEPDPRETPLPAALLASLPGPDQLEEVLKPAVRPAETPNECLVAQICIDDYLWSLYEGTPKVDTNKVRERIKATVRKKGKLRTVIKTITKYVVGDFTWKDPIAAQRAGMSLKDYVIGGMDRHFRLKLYYALRAMENAGFMPGITSAFRDDYRQSIASGNRAASDSSYHGGSRRGGYGHGLAADLVSVKGDTRLQRFASSVELWKWIDAHEKELGIGRPYLDRDPPHVGPLDGKEYAAKRGGARAKLAGSAKSRHLVGHGRSVTKPATKAAPVRVGSV